MYTEKLAAADESAWKDSLECMGNTPDIPKLFRHSGKVLPPQLTDRQNILQHSHSTISPALDTGQFGPLLTCLSP